MCSSLDLIRSDGSYYRAACECKVMRWRDKGDEVSTGARSGIRKGIPRYSSIVGVVAMLIDCCVGCRGRIKGRENDIWLFNAGNEGKRCGRKDQSTPEPDNPLTTESNSHGEGNTSTFANLFPP